MLNRFLGAATVGTILLSLGAVILIGQRDARTAIPAKNFPVPGGNLGNQRYSSLKQITPGNVSRLGGAWLVHVMDGTPGNMQATPIVVDGVMYISAEPGGGVLALDAVTGAVKWRHKSAATAARTLSRGVAVGDGKVFSTAGGNTLMALDQKDGTVLWTITVGERGSTPAPPIYYDGLVYIGVAGGETGVRGSCPAVRASLRWQSCPCSRWREGRPSFGKCWGRWASSAWGSWRRFR